MTPTTQTPTERYACRECCMRGTNTRRLSPIVNVRIKRANWMESTLHLQPILRSPPCLCPVALSRTAFGFLCTSCSQSDMIKHLITHSKSSFIHATLVHSGSGQRQRCATAGNVDLIAAARAANSIIHSCSKAKPVLVSAQMVRQHVRLTMA